MKLLEWFKEKTKPSSHQCNVGQIEVRLVTTTGMQYNQNYTGRALGYEYYNTARSVMERALSQDFIKIHDPRYPNRFVSKMQILFFEIVAERDYWIEVKDGPL